MDGYKEAEKIDKQINKLLKKFPYTKENLPEWMRFTNVIRSSCNIVFTDALASTRRTQ